MVMEQLEVFAVKRGGDDAERNAWKARKVLVNGTLRIPNNCLAVSTGVPPP